MVRTRFAPSPTGFLHIGNLRTAVYAYALAKHSQGQFILRIEDTDQKRYVQEGIADIKNILTKFNLLWDELYVQSDRKKAGVYQQAAEKLVAGGHAFYCQCQAKNAKTEGFSTTLRDPCRDLNLTTGAVKLKVPDGETISYHDFVLNKDISWQTDTVYDATLLKSDGFPTYHLAAMFDDLDMKITHILRGHDWMPSTPIHLLVFKYLGGTQPQIGHLSDIQSSKGGKLSKRRDAVFCEQFLKDGYLPEALLNFVILLGWAPKDNRELFTLQEFVQVFDSQGFQKANPLFTDTKLDWFNGQYIRRKSDQELYSLVKPFMKTDLDTRIISLVKDRLVKLSDISSLTAFFTTPPSYSPDLWKDPSLSLSEARISHLSISTPVLVNADWTKEGIEKPMADLISQNGWKTGEFFMSLRIAVCGSRTTPPITETMLILGKDETLRRLDSALNYLKSRI